MERKALSEGGAFVRRTARKKIGRAGGRKKGARAAGKPPTSPTGVLVNSIFFAFDRTRRSVVVGPSAEFGRRDNLIPSVLETGGVTTVRRSDGGRRRVNTPARPYMLPSLEENIPKLPLLFKDKFK